MQEAFGGTFMLKLFMIFFVIYVAFIGIALNFAKVYRVKNNVINIIEQYQYDMDKKDNGKVYTQLGNYLSSVPYIPFGEKNNIPTKFVNHCQSRASENEKVDKTLFDNYGVCVIQKGEAGKHYYNVTVYYVINFPILEVIELPITASGETIVIN